MSTSFPAGSYFSVIGNVRLEAGGQTRMALLRHRLFTRHSDVDLPILTFNPLASYDPIRAALREQGQLLPESELRNLHEELRTWPDLGPGSGELVDLGTPTDDVDDQHVWRRRYRVGSTEETWDYLRPDGSRYLRTPPTDVQGDVVLCGDDGLPLQTWPGLGGLWRWWTERIAPVDGPVFLISDSRFIATELALLDERFHVVHQMHNPHVSGDRLWSSPVVATYRESMDRIADLDGLLSLTERQREDVAKRYGATDNLFVVPNPVESPPLPDTTPERTPHGVVMIARLDHQKRLDRAIDAFARVHRELPDATLDVYGDGPLRADLERRISAAGLTDAVTLHGHDPAAREALWHAGLFWLTSQFEGYPLSTLEAMSHRVPVVSMDVTYGPREQVTDGVDGALVPVGDVETMAARTLDLFRDPDRLEGMRDAARATAEAHGHARFLDDWRRVVAQVAAQAPRRPTVEREVFAFTTNEVVDRRLSLEGVLELETPDVERLDEVTVLVQAWSPGHEPLVDLPAQIDRSGGTFSFRVDASVDVVPGARHVLVRVGYVWANHGRFVEAADVKIGRRRWFRRR